MSTAKWKIVTVFLLLVQIVLLAVLVSDWWAYRSNTLFDNGRWIAGKNRGKYLFYTLDFLFKPLTEEGVELTGSMGFQEILYGQPEGPDRELLRLACNTSIAKGGYLWIELRKSPDGMLGCRFSRNKSYPSGFYRYDANGEIIEQIPFNHELPRGASSRFQVEISLNRGVWIAYAEGLELGSIDDTGTAAGYFGFRGSGWNRRPVKIQNIEMAFRDPENPENTWKETECFSPVPAMRRVLLPVFAFSFLVILIRHLRQRVLCWYLSKRIHFLIGDNAGQAILLSIVLCIQILRHPVSGLPIPLYLLIGELYGLIVFALAAKTHRRDPSGHWGDMLAYGITLAGVTAAAFFLHGEWLGRTEHETLAKKGNRQLAALILTPNRDDPSEKIVAQNIRIVPGQPFLTGMRAYRDQIIRGDFSIPPQSTLDMVFQQQSYLTRGDPVGEQMPLQRRLLRLSTREDISGGLSTRTDNRPAPFLPVKGKLYTDKTNHIELRTDTKGIQITLNGAVTTFPSYKPIGYGETGLLAYEGPVIFQKLEIKPITTLTGIHAVRPLIGVVLLLFLPILLSLILLPGGRLSFGNIFRLEWVAFFPLAFYMAATLFTGNDTLTALHRTRFVWLDIAAATWALSHIHILIATGPKLRLKALYGNLFTIGCIAALVLAVWDFLPQDHPFRLRFTDESIVPGEAGATGGEHGPWYNINRIIGASTYIWQQRFGKDEITLEKPEDVIRIFVVGGSQAWGSGAASSDDTFAELLEKKLLAKGHQVEVYNAAANGGGIRQAVDLYWGLLRHYKPDIVIADVGLNETTGLTAKKDEEQVRKHINLQAENLGYLLQFCTEDNADTILVLEPMCGETPLRPIEDFYNALERTASNANVIVVKPAALLAEKETDHFVWWDTAHLAPYGQQLMADAIAPALEAVVTKRESN